MTVHQLDSLGVEIVGTVSVPDRFPEVYAEEFFGGIGHWIASDPPVGGPREVVGGVFRSWSWSYDNNHLTTVGRPGMLHLLAYADYPYWNYVKPDGSLVTLRLYARPDQAACSRGKLPPERLRMDSLDHRTSSDSNPRSKRPAEERQLGVQG